MATAQTCVLACAAGYCEEVTPDLPEVQYILRKKKMLSRHYVSINEEQRTDLGRWLPAQVIHVDRLC